MLKECEELNKLIKDYMYHMVGKNSNHKPGYRNYYCASNDDKKTIKDLETLLNKGLIKKGRVDSSYSYYHCTEKGLKLIKVKLTK